MTALVDPMYVLWSVLQYWCVSNCWTLHPDCIKFWYSVKLWTKKNCSTYKNNVDSFSLDGYMYVNSPLSLCAVSRSHSLIYSDVLVSSEKSSWHVSCICQTHPKQTCFMSSVDLHTHYSYQVRVLCHLQLQNLGCPIRWKASTHCSSSGIT
jgi:hypothetical protein